MNIHTSVAVGNGKAIHVGNESGAICGANYRNARYAPVKLVNGRPTCKRCLKIQAIEIEAAHGVALIEQAERHEIEVCHTEAIELNDTLAFMPTVQVLGFRSDGRPSLTSMREITRPVVYVPTPSYECMACGDQVLVTEQPAHNEQHRASRTCGRRWAFDRGSLLSCDVRGAHEGPCFDAMRRVWSDLPI